MILRGWMTLVETLLMLRSCAQDALAQVVTMKGVSPATADRIANSLAAIVERVTRLIEIAQRQEQAAP